MVQNEMFSPSGEYSESRPFKIFISLLDKWEIGGPLADTLVYEAFKAIKKLMEDDREGTDDVIASNPYLLNLKLIFSTAGYDGKYVIRGVGARNPVEAIAFCNLQGID